MVVLFTVNDHSIRYGTFYLFDLVYMCVQMCVRLLNIFCARRHENLKHLFVIQEANASSTGPFHFRSFIAYNMQMRLLIFYVSILYVCIVLFGFVLYSMCVFQAAISLSSCIVFLSLHKRFSRITARKKGIFIIFSLTFTFFSYFVVVVVLPSVPFPFIHCTLFIHSIFCQSFCLDLLMHASTFH